MVWIKFKRQHHHDKITTKNSTAYQDGMQSYDHKSQEKVTADDVELWKIEANLESLLHENINNNMITTSTTTTDTTKLPTAITPPLSTTISLNGTPSFLAPLLPSNNHIIFLKNNGAIFDNLFKLGNHSNNNTTAAAAAAVFHNSNNNSNNSTSGSSSMSNNNDSNLLIDLTSTSYDLSMTPPSSLINDTNYWHMNEQDFDYLYRHSFWMSMLLIFAYIVVFVVGLVGNSFVISVVLRAPRMRTVTNYFIVNLALADILVIVFCLPATLMSNIFLPWLLGWLMCKTVPYIQGVSVAASVYSLIAVSLDRLIAIWWPLKQMTKSRARFMIGCIWIIALSSTIPWVLFFDLVPANEVLPGAPDMYLCQEVWPPGTNGNLYFLLAHLIACYLLPMTLITMCYILIWIKVSTRSIPGDSKDAQMDRMQQKSKVKVIKMLVAVVILFVLSWLPLYVIFARIKFGGEISIEESEILNTITPFAQWLGSSNSCINPILYAFFNNKYRRGFAAIIKSRSCCARLRYYDNVAIASSTTSTRKSSHNSRKGPGSPGLRKNNAVSYIYEHNSLRRPAPHYPMAKQDSNLSQRMLLKQDSHGSRQMLIKQESISSEGSRRPLCQQDSNTSKISLSKQDSVISYVESNAGLDAKRNNDIAINNNNNNNNNNFVFDHKQQKFVKQDSVISFVDQRPETRRHKLMKQDSIISFADQRRGLLNKQDSIVACSSRNGDAVTHTHPHVSILKKTDSLLSSASFTPTRLNIEIYE